MESLLATELLRDRQRTLVLVESVRADRHRSRHGCHVHGERQPLAVVVRTPTACYALDLQNRPLELAGLLDRVPGLAAMLDHGDVRER